VSLYYVEEEFEDLYQRGIQNPYIKEEHNGQKKKYKRTNNDLLNIHITLKIE